MVDRIKKPSTPSNCAKNKVDHHISLRQKTEERWLHSVLLNSRLVFNRKSFSTLTAARLPLTRAFCCCASSTSKWRSRKNSMGFSTTGVIRCSSSTTPMRCSAREFIRSPQATRIATTPRPCAVIPPFKPSWVNPILWPLSPRSRAWRIRPMSKPSNGWVPWVLSGFCKTGTRNDRLPRKSY